MYCILRTVVHFTWEMCALAVPLKLVQLGCKCYCTKQQTCMHFVKYNPPTIYVLVNHPSRCSPSGFMPELSRVLLVNTNGSYPRFEWLVPLLAYKLSSCFSPLPCSLFYPNRNALPSNFWQRISPTFSYVWLYPSKQAVDCFMLFACLDRVALLPGTLSRGSSDSRSLCPCYWRWQIIDREEYE